MATRKRKFAFLREKLDKCGYNEPLSLESMDLVDALFSDLIFCRNKFMKHKEIGEEALQKARNLEESIRPLEEERNKLLNENQSLRHEIHQNREQYEKELKDLKNLVAELESTYTDLEFKNMEQMTKIGVLEEEILMQNEKLMKYEGLPSDVLKRGNAILKLKNSIPVEVAKQETNGSYKLNTISSVNSYLSEILAYKCPQELSKEVENLKAERRNLSESIEYYKSQIKARDEQISRLIEQPSKNVSTQNTLHSCRCHSLELDDESLQLSDYDIKSKFDELNKRLQFSVNSTLSLAEKVKLLEKLLKEQRNVPPQIANNENMYTCICREIEKLKGVFHNCRCGRSSSESKLTLKINELLKMLDDLAAENKYLQNKLEECEFKGIPKQLILQNESMKMCYDDLKKQVISLEKENAALLQDNLSLKSLLENNGIPEKMATFKSSSDQSGKVTCESSSSSVPKKSVEGSSELLDENDSLNKCCADLKNQLMSVIEENHNLRQANLSQKSSTEKPKPFEKTVAFKSSVGVGLESSSSSSSSKHEKRGASSLLNAVKKPVVGKAPLRSCCQNLRDEVMSLRGENTALKQSSSVLKSIIESFKSIRNSSECISRNPSDNEETSVGNYKTNNSSSSNKTEEKYLKHNFETMKDDLLKEVERVCKEICSPTSASTTDINERLKVLSAELETIRAERDFYIKEYYSLKDNFNKNKHDRFNNETEGASGRVDKRYFQDEVFTLQQKVFELQNSLQYDRLLFNNEKLKLEDTIKFHEKEKNKALSREDELLRKIKFLENTADALNKRVHDIMSESTFLQSQYNSLRSVNEHLQISLKNAEASYQKAEVELNSALNEIKKLENEKQELLADFSCAREELQTAHDKLLTLVKEKDTLLEKLDAQTIELCKLEKEKTQQLCFINMLEQKVSRLNCQAVRSTNEETRAERDIENLRRELQLCREERNKFAAENSILQSDLESLVKDTELRSHENENYKREIEKLKEQLQNYVQEVQRVGQILEAKEIEREEMLEQLKALSAEAINLDSNNQTLESEKKWTSNNLRIAQEKLNDLQETVQNKDSLVSDMEDQIMQLSKEVQFLKNELSNTQMENSRLQHEVETSKDLIKTMDYTKQKYQSEIHSLEEQVEQATAGINQSQALKDMLASQIEEQNNIIATLESAVSSSRKEAVEQSLQNFGVQKKIEELEKAVNDLQQELSSVNDSLWKCKETCEMYKEENTQLKRELIKERFEKVKAEETQSYSTSL